MPSGDRGALKSSRPARVPVKGGAGLARHLDGWQPGLLAVFIAGTSALLAVPKAVDPVDLPEPSIDARVLDRIRRADDALAKGAAERRLDVDVRALGDAYRAYGRADEGGDEREVQRERGRIVEAAARAMTVGAVEVVALRAWQLRAFQREVRRYLATGDATPELGELGGGFVRMLERNRWIDGRRLVIDDDALAATFKMRWNEVTSIHGAPFDLAIDEARAFYRFLLKHPVPEGRAGGLPEQYRLRKVDELAKADPAYPKELARGVLYYRSGRFPLAVEAFRRHLEERPEGPFTLRAQNYLRAALGRARDEP